MKYLKICGDILSSDLESITDYTERDLNILLDLHFFHLIDFEN